MQIVTTPHTDILRDVLFFHTCFGNINIILFENGILNVPCKLERVDVPTHETGLYSCNLISSSFERNRIVKKNLHQPEDKTDFFMEKIQTNSRKRFESGTP